MPHQTLQLDLGTHLLLQAKHGNRLAFGQAYLTYHQVVYDFLARRYRSLGHHGLEDLVHEVFLRTWAGRTHYLSKASAKTWLLAVARNVARERRRQRPAPVSLDAELPIQDTAGQDLPNDERTQAVRAAVAQLPPKQRQAIQLVYFDKLRRTQAAAMANCNQAVLRWRLADAHARLRRLLGHIHSHRTPPRGGGT